VPQGSFYVGSGGTEPGGFYKYPTTTNPYQITNDGEITVGTSTDNLYYVPSGSGGSWNGDGLGPIPSSFPKGYNAFYCMKYEITQQGYVNFLNSLTQTQATVRKYSTSLYRYAITGNTVGSYSTNNPYLPCNYLLWSDFAAYLDWCGLRPMTELEFEKACRGTLAPVPNEYAWGSISIAINPYALSDIGTNEEGISTNFNTTDGNATNYSTAWLAGFQGPVRVGIFAGNSLNTGRITSGAAYYGMMEMSGNMFEYTVAAGNPTGREFTPVNGNGMLTAMGESDAATWPPVSTATGIGFRGGDWSNGAGYSKLSARSRAAYIDNSRNRSYGGRGVRLEPIQEIKQ
jgi:formylglycine-generating enzyme required for sulfatase activity